MYWYTSSSCFFPGNQLTPVASKHSMVVPQHTEISMITCGSWRRFVLTQVEVMLEHTAAIRVLAKLSASFEHHPASLSFVVMSPFCPCSLEACHGSWLQTVGKSGSVRQLHMARRVWRCILRPQHPAWNCLAVVLCSWQAAQIPCDAGSINEMIKLMDANKDGSIGWGEFESFMMQVIRSVRFGPAWGWDMLRLHIVCISCGSWSWPGFTKVAGET